MKNYLNLIKKTSNSGFTLVELIVASVMTFFVVGGAGFGLFIMTRENVASNAASDTQYNLNRAAEFISDEIKASANITADSTLTTTLTNLCGAQSGAIPVLGLSVNSSGTTVVYYMRSPGSPWLGNNAIYRCGPPLNADGSYSTTATIPYTPSLLVDLIANSNAPDDTAGCPTGYTAYPNTTSGFFVCRNGNLAELHLAASALNTQTATGLSTTTTSGSRFADKATYGVITQAYARSQRGTEITVSPASVPSTSTTGMTFNIQRSGSTAGAVTVNFSVGGTATRGTHYNTTAFTTSPATISFAANEAAKSFTVIPISSATIPVGGLTVIITLTSGTGYTLGGTTSATGTINP